MNLAALKSVADGVFDLLALISDDTSSIGLSSEDKWWLGAWTGRLDLGNRFLMYPGADEVGCAVVARAVNVRNERRPRFATHYAVLGGGEIVAAFEDGPVQVTIERQVRAVGGTASAAEDAAASWLGDNPPLADRADCPPLGFPRRMPNGRRFSGGWVRRADGGSARDRRWRSLTSATPTVPTPP